MTESKPYKHCCVIDSAGFYVTLVLVLLDADPDGSTKENIQYYTLGTGESLINTPAPTNFVKAHWDGAKWEEGATPEEITAWEEEHPAPPAPSPAPVDILGAQVALLTIENIHKDQIINALGAQVAQTSLDMMALKGGM